MKQNEITKLQDQIAREAVALLSMQGELDSADLSVRAIRLIGQAWDSDPAATERNLDLIERERDVVRAWSDQEEVTHVLTEEEMLNCATGEDIVEIIWGCFETAIRLECPDDRVAIYNMANYLAECFCLEDQLTKVKTQRTVEEACLNTLSVG